MKQQFRFLIAGFSLIGFLVYTATPASAQADNTKFTVTLMALSISVTPSAIPLGDVSAGQVIESNQSAGPTRAPFSVNVGTGTPVQLFIAGTNARKSGDPTSAVTWNLDKGGNGPERIAFAYLNSAGSFVSLGGPAPPDNKFPAIGTPETLGAVIGTQTINWQFGAPTVSDQNTQQEFNITFAAATVGSGNQAMNNAFTIPTGTTTSGTTSPVAGP